MQNDVSQNENGKRDAGTRDVSRAAPAAPHDHLVVIKVEGMHCHKCEMAISSALQRRDGVHEVEIDFPSGLASVLFDPSAVSVRELMNTVIEAGYRAVGFTRGQGASEADHAKPGG